MRAATVNAERYNSWRAARRVVFGALLLFFAAACKSEQPRPNEGNRSAVRASAAEDSLRARADRARVAGDSGAPLWLLIVSDFQCPYCAEWHAHSYQALRNEYVRSGKVRLAYLNYPLEQHRHARVTANAALCAGAQDRFWPMHDGIFSTQRRWSVSADPSQLLDSLASGTGLDVERWRLCMRARVMDALVLADSHRVAKAGVQSTPTLLITQANRSPSVTHLIQGAVPLPTLRLALDSMHASGVRR